jgi:hypothetical protein
MHIVRLNAPDAKYQACTATPLSAAHCFNDLNRARDT